MALRARVESFGLKIGAIQNTPAGFINAARLGLPGRVSVAAGFSEYNVVPASVVYKLPAGVRPEIGALAEPLSCAMRAVGRGEIRPADTVAIVGAGALGLLVLAVVRLSGATRVEVSVPPTTARPALPAYELFARELTIRGSYVRTTEFRRAVELLRSTSPH